jgi:hypothetical protein
VNIVRILVLSGVIGVVLLPNILFGQDDKLMDMVEMDQKAFAEKMQEYRKIFLQ